MPNPHAGTLSVLNAGAGDLRISFNARRPEEVEQARKTVTDLLQQGYAIVIEDEKGEHRVVQEFDPATNEYIVAALPSEGGQQKKKSRRKPRRRVKASETRATAIAPSAGG